jgi:pimeloyl-ACP methyl ester carboxylesterase
MSATLLHFAARNGVRLDGAIVGSGPTGVVLLPEFPGSYCGWWAYAVDLARHGVRVLLFDYHCQGLSACGPHRRDYVGDVDGAVGALRAHGERTVALVGASIGGAVALAAAAQLHPAAVVDLSGESDPSTIIRGLHLDGTRFAPKLAAPVFFAVARGDSYVSVNAMRTVFRAARPPKTLKVLPTSAGHGWDMLTAATGKFTPLADQIIAFIKAHGPQATNDEQRLRPHTERDDPKAAAATQGESDPTRRESPAPNPERQQGRLPGRAGPVDVRQRPESVAMRASASIPFPAGKRKPRAVSCSAQETAEAEAASVGTRDP